METKGINGLSDTLKPHIRKITAKNFNPIPENALIPQIVRDEINEKFQNPPSHLSERNENSLSKQSKTDFLYRKREFTSKSPNYHHNPEFQPEIKSDMYNKRLNTNQVNEMRSQESIQSPQFNSSFHSNRSPMNMSFNHSLNKNINIRSNHYQNIPKNDQGFFQNNTLSGPFQGEISNFRYQYSPIRSNGRNFMENKHYFDNNINYPQCNYQYNFRPNPNLNEQFPRFFQNTNNVNFPQGFTNPHMNQMPNMNLIIPELVKKFGVNILPNSKAQFNPSQNNFFLKNQF